MQVRPSVLLVGLLVLAGCASPSSPSAAKQDPCDVGKPLVQGIVTDPDKNPLPRVYVAMWTYGLDRVVDTDAKGLYVMCAERPTDLTLKFQLDGYGPHEKKFAGSDLPTGYDLILKPVPKPQ